MNSIINPKTHSKSHPKSHPNPTNQAQNPENDSPLARQLKKSIYYDKNFVSWSRKVITNKANRDLIKLGDTQLYKYLESEDWQTFNTGFIMMNNKLDLMTLTKFPICPSNARNTNFLDLKQNQLVLCANFLDNEFGNESGNQRKFNEKMTYNLTLLYDELNDHKRFSHDRGDCLQVTCSQIRALH